ncbi:hypothetical protein PENTCL1PPCAC_14782 [Pristionchus entomophagus]|uniref:G protein-coupled receptor n=1 Tax=Pristionchus entomophagus TaxID=358040 RepID=A0AAV5TAN7_9BILA|nr:hypothetical protein PENTCL1PPCAC_14782 [Pristionchus entomophagus]
MSNLTLHPLWHTFMPTYERSVGVVTLILSAFAFYLMLSKTPQTAKPFAKYLMLLQASITLVDIDYGFLYCPISLFPIPGDLCYGILCTWCGFTGHAGMVLMCFALSGVGISIVYCFHFKYVQIGHICGKNSLYSARHVVFRIAILAMYVLPCLLQIANYRMLAGGPQMVKTEFPSLYYLFENPEYHAFAYDQTMFPEYELVLLVLCVVVS